MGPFYVYYLYNLDEDTLLYVGRALNAIVRWKSFIEREGVSAVLGRVDAYTDLDAACDAEREAIRNLKPLFNKRIASAKGNTGMHHKLSEETKAKMRKPKTAEHRKNIALSVLAQPREAKLARAHASHASRRANKQAR